MPKHGTAFEWSLGQHNEVLERLVRVLPKALGGFDPPMLINALEGRSEVLGLALQGALSRVARLYYPVEGEVFDLTVVGHDTAMFKLVRVGDCRDIYEVARRAAKHGSNAYGYVLREAFEYAYRYPDLRGPIGAAGFVESGGSGEDAVYIDHCGQVRIGYPPGAAFNNIWRWLVEVTEPVAPAEVG